MGWIKIHRSLFPGEEVPKTDDYLAVCGFWKIYDKWLSVRGRARSLTHIKNVNENILYVIINIFVDWIEVTGWHSIRELAMKWENTSNCCWGAIANGSTFVLFVRLFQKPKSNYVHKFCNPHSIISHTIHHLTRIETHSIFQNSLYTNRFTLYLYALDPIEGINMLRKISTYWRYFGYLGTFRYFSKI